MRLHTYTARGASVGSGYAIPDQYKKLENGDLFLQHDSGEDDEQRILVFATESGLDDLLQASFWAGDGTFKPCPDVYFQLFTLHVQNGKFSIPRVFVLLPDKREETYRRLYAILKELRPGLNPEAIMFDFEKASHNAFSEEFPEASVKACLFHLGQSMYRKIVDLGLKQQYHQDNEFSLLVRCFSALAFLPTEDVIEGFEVLTDDDDLAVPPEFVSYFETNYIGCLRRRGRNQRRLVPLFPVGCWNVHDRNVQGLPRTNNNLEGWHNAFQSSISCTHPNIWKLIDALKKEETLSQTKKVHFDRGDDISQKKKYKDVNKRIQTIIDRYGEMDKLSFLRAISYNLHLF